MLYPVKKNHLILVFLLLPTLLFFCISCGQSRSANGPNAYTSTHPASGRENNLNSAVDVSPSHVDSLARVKKLTLTSSEWGKAFSFSIIAKYAVLSGSTKFNYSHTSYCLSDTSYTTKDTFAQTRSAKWCRKSPRKRLRQTATPASAPDNPAPQFSAANAAPAAPQTRSAL